MTARLPTILPPARLGETDAARAGRAAASEASRGDSAYAQEHDHHADDHADPYESTMSDRTEHTDPDVEADVAGPADPDDTEPDDTDTAGGRLSLEGVADFNVVVADEAARAARERARLAAEAAEAAQAAAEQAASDARRHHDSVDRSISPTSATLHDVAEVSKQVIAAMRAINVAHHAHVESLELEAARRCELATAQAELDAELIRLHARREAHAVISAARLRAGDLDSDAGEPDQLGEIGETFSRFAETIEIAMAPGPEGPEPRRRA